MRVSSLVCSAKIRLPPGRENRALGISAVDIEGVGFVIGLIGAIWLKSSMNLMREYKDQPELKMIGREPENPALKNFLRGLTLVLLGLGIETYARLFLN